MTSSDLRDQLEKIETRQDLSKFINKLRQDFVDNPNEWENIELSQYLESMAAWICDMDGLYNNFNKEIPEEPTWEILGQILYAAKIYE